MTAKQTISRIGDYITAAEAEAAYRGGVAGDDLTYGDLLSSHQRDACSWGETLGNGFLTVCVFVVAKAMPVTKHRTCVTAAATGPGSMSMGVYTGSNVNALTQQRTWTPTVTTTGIKEQTFASLALTRGQYVGFAALGLAWTTVPRMSSTLTGVGFDLLLNPVAMSVYKSGQVAPLPGTLDLTTGFTKSNQSFWQAML
jgi:hypothetical protein